MFALRAGDHVLRRLDTALLGPGEFLGVGVAAARVPTVGCRATAAGLVHAGERHADVLRRPRGERDASGSDGNHNQQQTRHQAAAGFAVSPKELGEEHGQRCEDARKGVARQGGKLRSVLIGRPPSVNLPARARGNRPADPQWTPLRRERLAAGSPKRPHFPDLAWSSRTRGITLAPPNDGVARVRSQHPQGSTSWPNTAKRRLAK